MSLPWASGVPDRCGIFVGRYRPQIPWALGCQRGLALAGLGCTVDHLDPTPANLIPPSSFAVSCDLKALWPGVLGCWGMGGRCTTWPINPPEVYTSFGPDPPGRQAAGCPSAGDFVHSHCVPMWDGVSVDTVFYRIIRAEAIGTHSGGSFSILVCAHCRSPEYAISEMPSPVFMK